MNENNRKCICIRRVKSVFVLITLLWYRYYSEDDDEDGEDGEDDEEVMCGGEEVCNISLTCLTFTPEHICCKT